MHIYEHRLANGLQLLVQEDHSLPVVTVMVWYRVGSRHEKTGQTGISHFLEHLMFKGTDRFAKGEIDLLTLKNGGNNNAFTWIDNTAYYFNFAADRWQVALEIEANRMRKCLLLSEEVEAEREVILAEWRTGRDNAESQLWELVNATALTAHSYRVPVIGWPEDIAQMSRDEIKDYYERWYHPNHATVVIVGDVDQADVQQLVEKNFGELPAGPVAEEVRVQEAPQVGEKRVTLKRHEVRVPRLYVAWRAPELEHPDFYPLTVLSYLLSEGVSSLLHQELVEEKELAATTDAVYTPSKHPFLFGIVLELLPEIAPAKAEKALFQLLEKMAQGDWEEERLQRALQQVQANHWFGQETTEAQANFIGEIASITDWQMINAYVPRLLEVTKADVCRVVQQYFQADQRTVGWLLPLNPEITEPRIKTPKPKRKAAYTVPSIHLGHHSIPHELHFPVPLIERQVLSNGLTLVTHQYERTPTVRVEALIRSGSLLDPPGKQGLANLTAELLSKGTKAISATDLHAQIENVGGELSTQAGLPGIRVSLDLLSKDLPMGLELLAEILRYPAFRKREVDKEREIVLSDLQSVQEDVEYVAHRAFRQLVYGDFPAAHPAEGYLDTVQHLTRADLKHFYQQIAVPSNVLLGISGAIDSRGVNEQVQRLFGHWRGSLRLAPIAQLPLRQTQNQEEWIAFPGKEQAQILLGHLGVPRSHPDYAALVLLDLILGWGPGFTARIPARLRDEQGLAYSVSAAISPYSGLYTGLFLAQMQTKAENVAAGIEGLKREIRLLQQAGVTPEELSDAQAYVSGSFVFNFETNYQRLDYCFQKEFYQWPDDYLNQYLAALKSVTPADIQRVAQTHLNPDHLTLVVAGPPEICKPQ